MLCPGAPAGRVVDAAVSLRDLPATVLDLLGLADGSPLPGHSLAAYWWLTPGQQPPVISPAFSDLANQPWEPGTERGPSTRPFEVSLVAQGRHFFRDRLGSEHLHDLATDPFEHVDLVSSPGGSQLVGVYRRMLLDVLTAYPGSSEAENIYLKAYKRWLESVVDGSSSPGEATTTRR